MNTYKLLPILLLVVFGLKAYSQSGTVNIKVDNIKTEEGNIKLALFDTKTQEHFAYKPENAVAHAIAEISGNSASAQFQNLPYGKYAVSVFHDINNDGELNRSAIGYPAEPYGFSNNPSGLAVPAFEKAAFLLKEKTTEITIELKFFSFD